MCTSFLKDDGWGAKPRKRGGKWVGEPPEAFMLQPVTSE